jgi:hypothetical protein
MEKSVKLSDEQIRILEELPESGMGYQIVNITLRNGLILKDRIVMNSTYLKIGGDEEINPSDILSINLKK